nr:cytochrome p450 monooxygenase 1 [Quercus suber]
MKEGTGDIATVRNNAATFILSALETLPGYSCSVLYYLLETPEYFEKASTEVRAAFSRIEDITLGSAQMLEFLIACMRETLRVSPPAVGTLPRRIPATGATICDRFVPGNMTVGIHNWSITHSGQFWKDPGHFRPERWLGDAKYSGDQRESRASRGHSYCYKAPLCFRHESGYLDLWRLADPHWSLCSHKRISYSRLEARLELKDYAVRENDAARSLRALAGTRKRTEPYTERGRPVRDVTRRRAEPDAE